MRNYFKILAVAISMLGFSSCINESLEAPKNQKAPTSVKELIANNNFSWKTSNNIDVTLIGSNNMVVSILTEDGKVCFKGLLKNGEPLIANLIMSSSDKNFKVVYGPASKIFDVNKKSIVCNFNE